MNISPMIKAIHETRVAMRKMTPRFYAAARYLHKLAHALRKIDAQQRREREQEMRTWARRKGRKK